MNIVVLMATVLISNFCIKFNTLQVGEKRCLEKDIKTN